MVGGGLFCLPHHLFHSTLLSGSLPVKNSFKNEMLSLHFSREAHGEIWSRRFFSLMWNPNIKAIHIPKLVQMIFTAWFGYFEYVGELPRWYTIDCSHLMSQFDRCQLQLVYLTMEHRPARNLQHETLQTVFDIFNQSQYRLHTLQKSFFVSVEFLPFLK